MIKNLIMYPINLKLFDGAAPSGGAAGTSGVGVASGDTSTSSAAGEKEGEQVINDVNGSPQVAAVENNTTSNTLEARKAEFEKFIAGDYKDLFTERVQGIINNRFKEFKTLESQVNAFKPLLEILGPKYGVTDGDISKLAKAVENDESFYEDEALEKGLTVEQLKYIKQMERENASLKQAQAEIEARKNAEQTYQKWMTEADTLKQTYPNFDLRSECNNPEFLNMLKAGVGVKAAFNALHHDEILNGTIKMTAKRVQEATVNNVTSRSQRPSENGISSQAGVVVNRNISDLSMDDIFAYAERAKKGETIKL